MFEEPTRREVLLVVRRLAYLGLLETLRPTLMRNSEVAELLAQEASVPKGNIQNPTSRDLSTLSNFIEQQIQQIVTAEQQLSGMLIGVGYSASVSLDGLNAGASGGIAFSYDSSSNVFSMGLYGSAGISMNAGAGAEAGYGPTLFVGAGDISGLYGPSSVASVGRLTATWNQSAAIISANLGAVDGLSVGISTNQANNTIGQSSVVSWDLTDVQTTPFVLFYDWLDALSAQNWLVYSPDEVTESAAGF